MKIPIKVNGGVNQGDLVGAVVALAHCVKDICTKLDADAGVTDTDYQATQALYYTVNETLRSVLDLEKA